MDVRSAIKSALREAKGRQFAETVQDYEFRRRLFNKQRQHPHPVTLRRKLKKG